MTKEEKRIILDTFRVEIDKFTPISDKIWEIALDHLNIRRVDKKVCILKHGRNREYFYFIYSGIVKSTYHLDDSKFTNQFYVGPSPCIVPISTVTNNRITLATVTPTILIELKSVDINNICALNPSFRIIVITIIREFVNRMLYEKYQMRFMKADGRYNYLIENYPSVVEHAKLVDIASFLNVIPSSLSRIRRETIKNKAVI